MTNDEAKDLKPGQSVEYLGIPAKVRGVRKNGIIIEYWGCGLRYGTVISRRVSARFLKVAS